MELYDYLWLPENKSNTGCFRQKIQFGETAVADKIARRTMPYLAALGVTPDMTGYYMLSRAVALFVTAAVRSPFRLRFSRKSRWKTL